MAGDGTAGHGINFDATAEAPFELSGTGHISVVLLTPPPV